MTLSPDFFQRSRRNLFLLLLLLSFSSLGFLYSFSENKSSSGNGDPSLIKSGAQILDEELQVAHWTAELSKKTGLKIGDKITLELTGHADEPGWHFYSSKDGGMGYRTTLLDIDKENSKDVELVSGLKDKIKPVSVFDDIMGDTVRSFNEHEVPFTATLKVTGPNPHFTGFLDFQTCVDPDHGGKCLFGTVELDFDLGVENSGTTQTGKNNDNSGDDPAVKSNDENTDDAETQDGNSEEDVLTEGADSSKTADGQVNGSDAGLPTPIADLKENKSRTKKGQQSLIFIFLEAFLFGFAAVLTPCVFPMIPMTVTFFTKQSGTRSKGLRNALLYGAFIIIIYTALGLGLSIIFGEDFLYRMSINPWVNLAFFAILFIFALSFLGLFEITLPSGFVNKIDSQSNRGGIIGIFFMALTLALVSFSCTGPLVGTALIDAVGGSFLGPVTSMLGFSVAIAIPFCLLAVFPGWMNSLPKSGGWLNSVKVVLGFAELALAMKFLSQADLVMKWHILDREVFIAAWIVIFGLLGLYLLGKLRLPHDSPVEKISVPRLMLAMSSLIFAFYLVPGLWGANLAAISGLLPPHNPDVGVRVLGQKNSNLGTFNHEICTYEGRKHIEIFEEKEGHGFCTFYDLEQAANFAREKNMPLFLDFTGHTCANCRLMENNVWIEPEIEKILKEEFVMVSLYADEKTKLEEPVKIGNRTYKRIGDKNLAFQREQYGTSAQPYYVIMDPYYADKDPKFSNLSFPVGYTPDVKEYRDFLEYGIRIFRERHGK